MLLTYDSFKRVKELNISCGNTVTNDLDIECANSVIDYASRPFPNMTLRLKSVWEM